MDERYELHFRRKSYKSFKTIPFVERETGFFYFEKYVDSDEFDMLWLEQLLDDGNTRTIAQHSIYSHNWIEVH